LSLGIAVIGGSEATADLSFRPFTGRLPVATQQADKPERRKDGAEDPRVRFAAERTLLAWIRTGLALMGFGFVVARFGLFLREMAVARQATPIHSYGWSLWIGTGLVVLGIAVVLLAAAQHWRILQRLNRGEGYIAPRWSLGLVVSVLLAILGAAMVAYLLFVSS
jgi:putative membrane protein